MAKDTTPSKRAGHVDPRDVPHTVRDTNTKKAPTDVGKPSETDDYTGETDPDQRPTAREGLKPIGREIPHPTAAARPGKTSGEPAPFGGPGPVSSDKVRTEERPFKVEATQMGYYDHTRRRTGDVFEISGDSAFSEKWMARVDGRTPTKVTTGNEDLRRQHDEILGARHGGKDVARRGASSGNTDDPLNA